MARSCGRRPNCVYQCVALPRIVLGVGEEVIQFAVAERLYYAVIAPPFGVMEVIANQAGKLSKAGIVRHRGLVGKVVALSP